MLLPMESEGSETQGGPWSTEASSLSHIWAHLLPCKTETRRWSQRQFSRLSTLRMLVHPRTELPPQHPPLTWADGSSLLLQVIGSCQVILWDDPNHIVEFSNPPSIHVVLLRGHSGISAGTLVNPPLPFLPFIPPHSPPSPRVLQATAWKLSLQFPPGVGIGGSHFRCQPLGCPRSQPGALCSRTVPG